MTLWHPDYEYHARLWFFPLFINKPRKSAMYEERLNDSLNRRKHRGKSLLLPLSGISVPWHLGDNADIVFRHELRDHLPNKRLAFGAMRHHHNGFT